jgi:Na+-transporting NADH:ubiquinone oxidoreductase subunit NqrB
MGAPVDRIDPRYFQIATLATLLVYGLFALDFEVAPLNAAVILATAQAVQWAGDRWAGRRYDPRSALISSLSLCLLLRTNEPWVAGLAAAIAIGSKYAIRVGGRHVYNPTNFGIVVTLLLTGSVWVSPGQWGNAALLALFFACLGTTVVHRSERSDVTFAFLGFYAGLLLYRSVWLLGEPISIPLHRLQSGALLLFAFFMISDPKTTPASRPGRIAYAALVAFGAYVVTFWWFRTNGLLWSLVTLAPVVPILDRLLPGKAYEWRGQPPVARQPPVVEEDVPVVVPVGARSPLGR